MSVVGHVESVWRYPVKSMRGERVESAFVGFAGVYGDRLYAFQSSAAEVGFPFLTARAVAQLCELQAQYADWLEALPANQHDSALAEALQAICELDLSELESVAPPRGFGRD